MSKYHVEFDGNINCYVMHFNSQEIYLRATSYHPALCEADAIAAEQEVYIEIED